MNILDPANVDIAALQSVENGGIQQLPNTPAIYFVLSEEKAVVYIGQSVSLRTRWGMHRHRKTFAHLALFRIAWIDVDPTQLQTLEAAMIAHYAPSLNRMKGAGGRPARGRTVRPHTVMLPDDLYEWAMAQPEGFSALTRRLLTDAVNKIIS